jgi:hypothetical protein
VVAARRRIHSHNGEQAGLGSQGGTRLERPVISDLIKRWQGAADPSDNQLACEERDIAMMRKIAAACLLVLLVAPLRGRTDDDFSCV